MKRWLLSLTFIVLAITCASAQKLQFGLQAALGFSAQSVNDPDVLSTSSITTYALHGTVDVPLKKEFYLQAGLGVVSKGGNEYLDAETHTYTLTYFDVPVTLLKKFDLPTLGKIYVGAGPYASVGLSGTYQLVTVASTTGSAVLFGNDEDFKKVDLGVNFATGLELNNHLTLNLRYSLGLNNIAATDDPNGNTVSVKNRLFTIGLGFWF